MFRFRKKSRNRRVTKNARFLRLKRLHRKSKHNGSVIVGIKRAVKRTPYNVSPTKPLRLRRGSVKSVATNTNNHYQPPAKALKVTKPLTSKPPCQKRKERRSVLLAKGLGGAIHKPRKWNASSFEKCGG